ncbi:MAG: GNAT family N-acetyltransferase [Candidatus Edwardsbacteria bacterium]|nr:GNAT family N-acetyltransferase [Candidatus Edwardsbacteria bacterium]
MSKQLKNNAEIKVFDRPDELPEEWDMLYRADDILNKTPVLRHLFLYSPLEQKYFWLKRPERKPLAGPVCRSELPFTAGPITVHQPATVCSLSMPFSTDPAFSDIGRVEDVVEVMGSFGGGFQLISGFSEPGPEIDGWSWRRHYPTVDFDVRWGSFAEYLGAIRSDYKSRVTDALRIGCKLRSLTIPPDSLDEKTYSLYVDVARRYHSIVLPREFFTKFPTESYILGLEMDTTVLAWAFLVPQGRYLYFLFGGFNDRWNEEFSIYNNLLLAIIRFSIENKFDKVNLGQTAELSKMRIGGYPRERFLLVRHTNCLINQVIKKTDIFSYRKKYPTPHVFKNDEK